MAKRAMFATFAISIKDQLCLLQQYKWNTIKIRLPRLIIKVPYKSTFMTILDFFISPWKKWPLLRGNFGSCGCDLVAIAIVERSKQESMYGLSPRTKKVANVEGWPLWRGSCYWRFNCINEQAREQRQNTDVWQIKPNKRHRNSVQ